MPAEVRIASRFNGPPDSGNGGYACGLLASFIDGPARVRLHAPPPLETPLEVQVDSDGSVRMRRGELLVGTAWPGTPEMEIPAAPGLDIAGEATARFPCREEHFFPTCFVCGPERPARDGLEIYPGPVAGTDLVACAWHPAAGLLDDTGKLPPEILWSALDCPGYFAAVGTSIRPAMLGELEAVLYATVEGTAPLVVYAWPLGEDGRKLYAGSAVATAQGELVAAARSTWIALRV